METLLHDPSDLPRSGFFKTRLVKDGPWLAAKIFPTPCHCTVNGGDDNEPHLWKITCDRYPHPKLSAEVDGEISDPSRVWGYSNEIDRDEYQYLLQSSAWDKENDPDSPYANPDKPVDLHRMKPIAP